MRSFPCCFSLVLLASACSPNAPVSKVDHSNTKKAFEAEIPWFEEIAGRARLSFNHVSGASGQFWMPESMVGGVGLLDFDSDGWIDVFFVQGGSLDPKLPQTPGNRLFRNLGKGRFEDVSEKAGLKGTGYGSGCSCADYDGDGDIDIYVTNVGPNTLYRNNGDQTFTDVSMAAGVANPHWGTSSAFLDYNNDGHLDLFVVNYLHWSRERELECYSDKGFRDYCSPLNYRAPAMDALYRNKGDGTFEEVTMKAGLDTAFGNGLGVVSADFNQDGHPDIYVANDAMPNQLWMNQGHGKFKEEAMTQGCAVNHLGIAEAGMGVVGVDIQGDGLLDLFMTHLVGEANRLYLNKGSYFIDSVTPKGPGALSWPYTGFGLGFADFDHDGNLDLYVANGRIKHGNREWDPADPYAEPNHLLRGLGQGDFEEVQPHGGVSHPLIATSRGMAIGDLDNDGDVDIVVVNRDGPAHLLENRVGSNGNWLMLRVLTNAGSDAIGATIRIGSGDRTQWRQVNPNQGYCSSNDPRIHVGLGASSNIDEVTVFWPSGKEERYGPFKANQIVELVESAPSISHPEG